MIKIILTGKEIAKERNLGNIVIEPFYNCQINPNSYNYRLSPDLICIEPRGGLEESVEIPEEGYVLQPHITYLGSTYEILGSDKYAMSLIGRSSLGRLGFFLQVSADLGHTGSEHSWTLEMVCCKPFRIYPHMIIGQISFWENYGDYDLYTSGYSSFNKPQTSLLGGKK